MVRLLENMPGVQAAQLAAWKNSRPRNARSATDRKVELEETVSRGVDRFRKTLEVTTPPADGAHEDLADRPA